jgi:hypothetical protein
MKSANHVCARIARALLPALAVLTLWNLPAAAAPVQPGMSTVIGTVIDQRNALPIKNATVVLLQGVTVVATGTTDAFGDFTISNVPAGTYDVSIRAQGYAPSTTLNVAIAAGTTITINSALRQSGYASNVRTIGTVAVSANALASATTITQPVSISAIQQTGQVRFADQLATLPAINLGTSSSPGDDVSIDIRGFGSSETATLLDGRPAGPLGVQAPNSFNYSDTPVAALESVDVAYGSGAQGLYGSDTIAGAVNMHLLNPTTTPQESFEQQVGGFGRLTSALNATGTEGKVGYAMVAGIAGFSGSLNGQIFQSARPGLLQPGSVNPPFQCSNDGYLPSMIDGMTVYDDVSACNQAAETYGVSQDSKLTTELGKLRYSFASNTTLTVSAYSTVQWADSTGNGDNDYLPYNTRLGQIELEAPNCNVGGNSSGPMNGYFVVTNPISLQTACYTAQRFAASTYGPDGGGAGRNRSASMRDYDAHFSTQEGKNNIVVDGYVNNYVYEKDSALSGGLDANGLQLGTPDFADYYNTHGLLLSDDFIGTDNDLGLGYALLNQLQSGQQVVGIGTLPSGESIFAFQPAFTPAWFREGSFFVRDTHEFGERFDGFLNAWVKKSNVTGKTTFDPRLSGQYRPDSNDVLRLTFGHSDGPPAPELKSTAPVFAPDPGSSLTNVSCIPGSNSVASGGNPNLTSESANDVELGYGHRFQADSNIQVNAYVTPVTDELFAATEPLLQYGANNVTFASTTLQNYLTHLVNQGCLPAGSTPADTYPFLGISTTYNLASELARGVDINGRYRFMPKAYIDYGWSVESSQQFDIPATAANPILQSNPTLLNGEQQDGLPLHQATVSLDVQPGPYEVRIDNFYIGKNNPLDRPAYWYTNAFITRPLDHGKFALTLGGTNIFNQAVQYFGLIGDGQPVAVNQFFPNAGSLTGLQQNLAGINSDEEFGLQPAQVTLTLTAHM